MNVYVRLEELLDELATVRRRRGMSLEQVAEHAELTYGVLLAWEEGRRPATLLGLIGYGQAIGRELVISTSVRSRDLSRRSENLFGDPARHRLRELTDGLKVRRDHLGLTQRELGEIVGVSQASVASIETGRNRPRPATFFGIVDGLNCMLGWRLPPVNQ